MYASACTCLSALADIETDADLNLLTDMLTLVCSFLHLACVQHKFFLRLLEKIYLHYAVGNCFPGNVTSLQCRFQGLWIGWLKFDFDIPVMQ